MYRLIRPLLFSLDAETSHNLVMPTLAKLSSSRSGRRLLRATYPELPNTEPVTVMGLSFPNRVGLAAGLDKHGTCADAFSQIGFGFVEMGTVTPKPQSGNPRPRLFRLAEHKALINRMGFNSVGLDQFLENVSRSDSRVLKGINIGKNAATPIEAAVDDYRTCLQRVYSQSNYVTINISSPNTENLRQLQHDEALENLLSVLSSERDSLAAKHGKRVPLVLKIAPDLQLAQIDVIAKLCDTFQIDGIAASNTTLGRAGVESHPNASESGGLSGSPVREMSTRLVSLLRERLRDDICIIGIGGIDSLQSAKQKLDAGADLVQIYTGFIYQGPAMVREIISGLGRLQR